MNTNHIFRESRGYLINPQLKISFRNEYVLNLIIRTHRIARNQEQVALIITFQLLIDISFSIDAMIENYLLITQPKEPFSQEIILGSVDMI